MATTTPSINIAPYMSKFVRSLHVAEEEGNLEMPFIYTQFGAVLMVDIVGFSEMTTIASSKGDFGAEMLSSQIGAYFDLAIRIIEYHGGDVVKFLGDALLVVFQPDPDIEHHLGAESSSPTSTNPLDSPTTEEPAIATASRRDRVIVRKAVDCGLELLSRLSNYRIYLSEKDYARKLSGPNQDDPSSGTCNSPLDDGNSINLTTMNSNQSGNSNSQWNSYSNGTIASSHGSAGAASYLSVPMARPNSSGQNGSGASSRRSSVPSNSVSPTTTTMPQKFASSNNLDITSSGGNASLGLGSSGGGGNAVFRKRDELFSSRPGSTTSKKKVGAFFANAKNLFTNSTFSDRNAVPAEDFSDESHELQLHMALTAGPIANVIIGDIGRENGLDNLLMQTTGRLEYAICCEQMSTIDDALSMARAGELTVTGDAWAYINPESHPFEPRRQCYILKNINLSVDPLLRKIRNDKLFNTSVESNPHYYKYINKSAIHRLILNPDNNFPAQFRTVTILFVSLGDIKPWTPEGLAICQRAIFQVHKVTSEYEGFIQQFAVDDKGATILCAFGLPYPRSHEREAVFAAKSAWMIRRRLLTEGIQGFKISLATGVIFTSMIGNEFRRDPAIVGDTIVIAVRILKFEHALESVVCDDATKEACTSDNDGLCEFEDLGEFFVKGKVHPLRIWRLIHFGAKKQIRRPDDIMVDETIGYEPEREKVNQFIATWENAPDKNTILVTGPRGSGKSMFYQQICHMADRNGYHVCSAASAEVEKNTQYYLCKFLLLGLFDIMRRKEIPYAAKGFNNLMTVPRDLGISSFSPGPGESPWRQGSNAASTPPSTINLSIYSGGLTQSSPSTNPTPLETPSGTRTPIEGLSSPLSQLGPPVRSSVVSNAPWDLSLSPIISHFGEQSKRSSTYVTKLQQLINVSLQKMGEGNEMMHMLHDIIAALSSDYSAPVMDDEDDQMLADFIVRMLNYASTFVKIIVMFEDVQWTDSKSLDIIQAIHDRCPKVLVVIFSRPHRDYGGNILHNITSHFKHLEISLDGLKRREIELALLKTFEENGVTKISPEVLELVQTKTKGNPKFVKNMANMLKDFHHVNIVEGELVTTGQDSELSGSYQNAEEMEQMLVKQDRKKMILMQYDRMPPKFQDFLKIASCLGDQFSLAEVSAIRPLETMLGVPEPGRSFPTMISDLDTFRFLSITTDHQETNVKFSEDVVMNTLYTFGSSSTSSDIYESIPYEERVSYHLIMGQFYESFLEPSQLYESVLEPGQFSDLLPLISRHYLKTEATEKKIKYLKALSAFDLKSNMLSDASQRLSDLIQIVDTARGGNGAGMVSQADLADIYGMKGEALSRRMRIEEAEPALLDSLARYGIHWPKTPQQWRLALLMEKWKFNLHGVSAPPSPGRKLAKVKVDSKTKVTLHRIIRVLGCLQNIYFWKTEPNAALLSTLYTLNYSRKLGLPSSEQTVSLGRYGILNYFKGNKQACMEYMEKARLADEAGYGTEGMLLSMRGYIEYCEGRPETAHLMFSDAISESKSFGVVSNFATFYRSVILKCAYRMWEGSFNVHPEDSALLRAMSAVAIQNGDSEGEALFAIPTLANLLIQDRLRDAESWVVLIERHIMPKSRLMNQLVIHGMLSYYYSKMGHFSKARIYAELVAEKIPEQGVAAHPFPLMCCAFTIMSLYEMLDSSSSHNNSICGSGHLVPSSSSSSFSSAQLSSTYGIGSASCSLAAATSSVNDSAFCAHKTEMILRPVIHCLSQDPFQYVALCFVTMAEALRHFVHLGSQQQQRDGLHILHRSWDRFSRELEGVQFVKAYYLTRMGRHSEDPREKSRHYCDAYVLFVSMAMDPSGWLTDLPVNWEAPREAKLVEMRSTIGSIATPR